MIRFIFFVCIFVGQIGHAEIIDRILAIVSNEVITLSDLKKFKQTLAGKGMFDERLLVDYTRENVLKSDRVALEILIRKKIIDVEIKRNGLQAPIEKVEQEINSIASRNNLSKEQLFQALKQQGMDIDVYKKFLRESLERQTLLEREVLSKIKISEENIATYFSKHNKLAKNKIFEYTIAHILFDPNKGGKDSAKSRAEIVVSRLARGEVFEKLAVETTEESNPSAGGLLGTFKSGEFSPAFENAVKNLDVGQYSKVIPSRSGFHIIKLINRGMITDPAFEKEKRQVQAILQQQEFKRLFSDWLERRRQELFVRLNNG